MAKKYHPKIAQSTVRALVGDDAEISIGPLSTDGRRKNLPSGKNFFDYVDPRGRFNVLKFFSEHTKRFPTLWIIAQRDEAIVNCYYLSVDSPIYNSIVQSLDERGSRHLQLLFG